MNSSRLEKQVEKLEAELKEKKAQISRGKRKERGGQLVALGIMVEAAFKGLTRREKPNCAGGPSRSMPVTSSAFWLRSSVWGWKKRHRNPRHKRNNQNPSHR